MHTRTFRAKVGPVGQVVTVWNEGSGYWGRAGTCTARDLEKGTLRIEFAGGLVADESYRSVSIGDNSCPVKCANCGDTAAYHGDVSNTCTQWKPVCV